MVTVAALTPERFRAETDAVSFVPTEEDRHRQVVELLARAASAGGFDVAPLADRGLLVCPSGGCDCGGTW